MKESGRAYLLANHHEFILGELTVPPSVSFLAITNERGLFIQERIWSPGWNAYSAEFYPVCKYCLRLCERQSSAYCCSDCFLPQLKKLIEEEKKKIETEVTPAVKEGKVEE